MAQDGVKEETLNSQTVNMEAVAELKAVYVNNTAEYARVGVISETHGLYSGERAGPRMIEVRGRISF
jgi:hypothetical protein